MSTSIPPSIQSGLEGALQKLSVVAQLTTEQRKKKEQEEQELARAKETALACTNALRDELGISEFKSCVTGSLLAQLFTHKDEVLEITGLGDPRALFLKPIGGDGVLITMDQKTSGSYEDGVHSVFIEYIKLITGSSDEKLILEQIPNLVRLFLTRVTDFAVERETVLRSEIAPKME